MKEAGVAPIAYKKKNEKGEYVGKIKASKKERIEPENRKYIRGLFGYGGTQKWFKANDKHEQTKDKVTIRITPCKDSDKHEANPYERIPSPILFSVVEKSIFILPGTIDNRILGKNYVFSGLKKGGELVLPIPDEFDLSHFIEWFTGWLSRTNEKKRNKVNNDGTPHDFEEDTVKITLIKGDQP